MAKQHKIKHYRQYRGDRAFRAKPHPVSIALGAVALVGLVFVGALVYRPVYDLITKEPEASIADPDLGLSSAAEPGLVQASEPEPEPQAPVSPPEIRAVYMPTQTARVPGDRDAFLASLAGSEINAVMIDVKDAAGNILFDTQNAQAKEWGAVSPDALDLTAFADVLKEKQFSLVVRMSAFRDPIAAAANKANAITYQNTQMLWLDNSADKGGKPWLNPYSPGTQDYLLSLAGEAADKGAVMTVLSDYQFPPYSGENATFAGASPQVPRLQLLQTYLAQFTGALKEKNMRVAPYLTAVSLTQEGENISRYGGSPAAMGAETYLIGALPYQFGGNYNFGGLVVEQPVQNPVGSVESIFGFVSGALQTSGQTPALIAMIQGGNEPSNAAFPYAKTQIDAQIGALQNRGINEYILYSTTGEYLLQETTN